MKLISVDIAFEARIGEATQYKVCLYLNVHPYSYKKEVLWNITLQCRGCWPSSMDDVQMCVTMCWTSLSSG